MSRSRSAAEGRFSALIAVSCADTAFSRASNARPIALVIERVLEQVLRELAERVLALARDAIAQLVAARFAVCHGSLLGHVWFTPGVEREPSAV